MGPGRPIEAHHRRHWALIVGSLYQGTSQSSEVIHILHIGYYILYTISYIFYIIQCTVYIYIYIRPIPYGVRSSPPPHTHIYMYIIDREGADTPPGIFYMRFGPPPIYFIYIYIYIHILYSIYYKLYIIYYISRHHIYIYIYL